MRWNRLLKIYIPGGSWTAFSISVNIVKSIFMSFQRRWDLQFWPKVLGTSQPFHVYYLLETDMISCKISLLTSPPLFSPPINVEIGMICSIFNIERGGGTWESGGGAIGIKLTPVNVPTLLTRIVGASSRRAFWSQNRFRRSEELIRFWTTDVRICWAHKLLIAHNLMLKFG